jgi:hypothetical protein
LEYSGSVFTAQRGSGGWRCDLALEDLAGRPLGEVVDEPDVTGVLVGGDALLDEYAQLAGVESAPVLSAMAAATSSPSSSCGISITAASRTSGCS